MKFTYYLIILIIFKNYTDSKSIQEPKDYLNLLYNQNNSENSIKKLSNSFYRHLNQVSNYKSLQTKWFKIQIKTLREHDLITDYPDSLFPLNEEWVWFSEDFLFHFSWINETLIEDEEVYILKGNDNFLLQIYDSRKYQDFFMDPNYDFKKFLSSTSTNKYCSRQMKALQFIVALKIESHQQRESYFAFLDFYRQYGIGWFKGWFKDLQYLSFNQLPKEIFKYKIAIKRPLLDYHYQKESDRNLFEYDNAATYLDIRNENYSAILTLDKISMEYVSRVGRFNKFIESIYLPYLSILNKTNNQNHNQYDMPYRIINKNSPFQDENNYYAIGKDKIKSYFNLNDNDNGYLAIFNRIEGETSNPNEVWISDQLLNYLKSLNQNISESGLKTVTHKEMIKKMCSNQNGVSTRLISLFIIIDYSPFLKETVYYQHSFNSKLLLRWACFPLNAELCVERSTSIACKYSLKNYPAKEFQTEKAVFMPQNFRNLAGLIKLDKSDKNTSVQEASNTTDTTSNLSTIVQNTSFKETSNTTDAINPSTIATHFG